MKEGLPLKPWVEEGRSNAGEDHKEPKPQKRRGQKSQKPVNFDSSSILLRKEEGKNPQAEPRWERRSARKKIRLNRSGKE